MAKLTLDPSSHFLHNAHTLVQLAVAAYEDDPTTHSSFRKTVFTSATLFNNAKSDTFGFVTADENNLVLAFRGTDRAKDWLSTNLDFRTRREFGGKVHVGFAEALDSVWDAVLGIMNEVRDNQQWIWVCGHSLGGALATLATRKLARGMAPEATCTFGQPRVGDHKFANGFTRTLYRFVNNRDIVPTVPPRFLPALPPIFYTHVGELQFFDADGVLTAGEDSAEPLGLSAELEEALGSLANAESEAAAFITQGFKDHDRKNYVRLIEANLPE